MREPTDKNNFKKSLLDAVYYDDKGAILEVIEKFSGLIKKYSKQLQYDCAESDLIIFLIEFIHKLEPVKIETFHEGQLVKFTATSLRNKTIDLQRKKATGVNEVHIESMDEILIDLRIDEKLHVEGLLEGLTDKQRKIVILKYVFGYSDNEIAGVFKISRQAVNRLKRRAVENLKREREER